MSQELIAIIIAAIGLAGLILRQGQRIDRLDEHLADVRERMARIEGLIEGWTRPRTTVFTPPPNEDPSSRTGTDG